MACLLFDGVDDQVVFTGLSPAMQDVGTGAWTAAWVGSRSSWTGGADGWDSVFTVALDTTIAAADVQIALEWQSSTILTAGSQGGGVNSNFTHGLGTQTNVPFLVVVSKAAGSATPEFSVKNLSTGAWTHGSGSAAFGNAADRLTAAGAIQLGAWATSDWFGGRMGLIGFWHGLAMTLAQREECGAQNRTSDLYNHSAGKPTSLTELTSTAPVDLAGGWSSIHLMGASVDVATLSWSFNGAGPPITTPNADAVYARLAPVAIQDAALGWPLLTYIIALCEMFKRVEQVARSVKGRPAYAQLLDINSTPDYALSYTGQFKGVTLVTGSTALQQRDRIKGTDGFDRGKPSALIEAVKATLTGTRFVALVERAGGVESAIQVSVRTSETPNQAATLTAAMAAKRAGLILTLVVTAAVTWGEMELRNPVGAWTSVEGQFATYANAEAVA